MLRIVISAIIWIIGSVYFVIIFLILAFCLLTLPIDIVYKIARFLFKGQLLIMGVPVTVSGYEKFEFNRPYIIMANHESMFDLFILPVAIPMRFIAVEAQEHFKYPMWGYLIKKWGNIPINRNNLSEAIKSINNARKILELKNSILMLPEGGRTLNGQMKTFKKGPFHLAKEAKADILPFSINGLFEFKKKNSWILKPNRVHVNFGVPIPYNSFKEKSIDEMIIIVKDRIKKLKES